MSSFLQHSSVGPDRFRAQPPSLAPCPTAGSQTASLTRYKHPTPPHQPATVRHALPVDRLPSRATCCRLLIRPRPRIFPYLAPSAPPTARGPFSRPSATATTHSSGPLSRATPCLAALGSATILPTCSSSISLYSPQPHLFPISIMPCFYTAEATAVDRSQPLQTPAPPG
ncbi:hypothetical protein BKA80DRAFT_70925 [Phyllosticta citrichinensis]